MITKLIFLAFPIFILLMPLSPLAQPDKPLMNVEQLIEEAVQNNPEILAAKRRWEVFKEKVPQARALPDPMLGLGITNLPTNFSF
jgi:cobalt-zinc-cadmium efflux system outer membrane protein